MSAAVALPFYMRCRSTSFRLRFIHILLFSLAFCATVATAAENPSPTEHWAFRPLRSLSVPEGNPGFKSPIDAFVALRLKEKGLTASPAANRVTLIRRLYLVMLGLPPTPAEVQSFVSDPDPKAFEKLVDQVLADPRYGERWARHWLDVIRFAESNGSETNRERPNAWRFRDYVINAFNEDKRYDQFIREQLAGDTLGAEVATGFLVGGPVDIVGSPDPVLTAQQRADELDDMVSTTGTAFLGLTLGCARCHTHKFDPIEHAEYYSMAAFFSGVKHGERPLPLPAEQKEQLARLDAEIADLEHALAPYHLKNSSNAPPGHLRPPVNAKQNEEIFPPIEAKRVRFTVLKTSGAEPCVDELEVFSDGHNVALASAGTKAIASSTLAGFEIHKLEHIHDGQYGNSRSWISGESGRGWVELEFAVTKRIGRVIWGRDREGKFNDRLATEYKIEAATQNGDWQLLVSSADRQPFSGESTNPPIQYAFDHLSPIEAASGKASLARLERIREQRAALARSPLAYAGTFVQPPATYRLHRGDPMQKREQISPGTLRIFQPLDLATNTPDPERRRQLADWIASPENPLTARVLVNRVWQYHFGSGLVNTPNDFGNAGARPSHPELLDWLASEFIANGWSVKALQRRILTSATWQQASAPRPEALNSDAGNRYLWRYAPRRLEAEAIRDSILGVSGNLNSAQGGPGFYLHRIDRENVYHYFPKEEFGPEETRRMIYAVKIRMEQDGVFGAFDCPDGSLVTPRRAASTTPLQALNLFNSRFILDQSEIFAQRLLKLKGSELNAQLDEAWKLAFNRAPTAIEFRDAAEFVNTAGLPALCRAILNANEFLFIP